MKVLTTLLLLCSLLSHLAIRGGTAPQRPQPSRRVALRLAGVDGKTYDVAEMRGNVLVISFGATWCLPCRGELAALEQLKKEYAGRPVEFLWVNIEGAGDISDGGLREYAKELKLTLPVLRDTTRGAYEKFAATAPARVRRLFKTPVPLVVFIDAAGYFAPPSHFGMSSPESYKAAVRARLDKLLSASEAGNPPGTR